MDVKYTDNAKELMAKYIKAGGTLQEAAAETVNMAAKSARLKYIKKLKSKTNLRNPKFTLGAIKIYLAKAYRSDKKTLRTLNDINSVIGVVKLRGGEHYLAIMETGGKKTGSKKTGGRVAIPLNASRGGDNKKPVTAKNRLTKNKVTQNILPNVRSERQRYAALYSMVKRGAAKKGIEPGLYQTKDAILSVQKRKVQMVRKADKKTIRVKALPLFAESINEITPSSMEKFFLYAANKKLRELSGNG